jgi:hypothetical protein
MHSNSGLLPLLLFSLARAGEADIIGEYGYPRYPGIGAKLAILAHVKRRLFLLAISARAYRSADAYIGGKRYPLAHRSQIIGI